MFSLRVFLFLLLFFSFTVKSQTKNSFSEAIEDNSFLIEEAYNQEKGVVQHISNGIYKTNPTKDFLYTFTQEWPIAGVKHQLSYSIPYSFIDQNSSNGLGDVMLNYRYQLFYKDEWACVSPRISFILPTGSYKKGLGMNTVGLQFNLPISKRISDFWVVHANSGCTLYADVKGTDNLDKEVKRNLSFYNFGGSIIWLANKNFNIMLECLENLNSEINFSGKVIHNNETIINPGLRAALEIENLQIVPGVSIPVSFTTTKTNLSALFYLSFEHPF